MRASSATTLFLHIGMHKSGTTALQETCRDCREFLAENNFIYHRDSQSDVNQNHLKSLTRDATQVFLSNLLRDALEEGPRGDKHLISGEDISYMPDSDFCYLIDVLEEYFDEIHIVAGVRAPFSYMSSAAQEILKEPFSTIQSLMQRPDVSPCYRERFEKAFLRLGRNKCHLFPYGPGIVEQLFQFMQIPLSTPIKWHNKSMSMGIATLLNAAKLQAASINNPIDTFEGVSRLIREFERISVDHRRFQVPHEIVSAWQGRIHSDLSWLTTVWNVPQDFFQESTPTISLKQFGV